MDTIKISSPKHNHFENSNGQTASTLYNLLKTGSPEINSPIRSNEHDIEVPTAKRAKIDFSSPYDPDLFQCWQCSSISLSEHQLTNHVAKCRPENPDDCVSGCPFCPRDANQMVTVPYNLKAFNDHLHTSHPQLSVLYCPYCLHTIELPKLEALVAHILMEHRIPWRPSPASLAYMRKDQLPHRVVTCMGCGWCTFVLRADNVAQPPTSLLSHLTHCPSKGGQVQLQPLSVGAEAEESFTNLYIANLLTESYQFSAKFARSFPLVRGYSTPSRNVNILTKSPEVNHQPKAMVKKTTSSVNKNQSCNNLTRKSRPKASTTPAKTKRSSPVKSGTAAVAAAASKLLSSSALSTTPSYVAKTKKKPTRQSDVSLALSRSIQSTPTAAAAPPPRPAPAPKPAVDPLPCLYVCPLCGDNVLASLRERDEHLQAMHNGELVFPCQICGAAFPLYITLRRHAATKHNGDYDTVRYGLNNLINAESIECPECKLVAFTDRSVLRLHLIEIHRYSLDRARIVVRTTMRLMHTPPPMGRAAQRRRGPNKSPARSEPRLTATDKKDRPKTCTLSRLERVLGRLSGEIAPMSCRSCRIVVENEKEFHLHMEFDHVEPEEECEQLGCQACGRIFFGFGGRIDLIGHLRVLHQDTDQSSALSCPHAEQKPTENISSDGGSTPRLRPCEALFSSPRLRQIHASASRHQYPKFACPLALELPDFENPDVLDLSDQLRAAIMETECAADHEGLMILAYCCPNCSRLFAGSEAPSRFATHRLSCPLEAKQPVMETANNMHQETIAVLEAPQNPPAAISAIAVLPASSNTAAEPSRTTNTLLESVLRQEPAVHIKR